MLARKLKAFGGEAEDYTGIVKEFCERDGRDFDEFMVSFTHYFARVKFADHGADTFLEAARLADEEPIPFPAHMGLKPETNYYARVYSVCVHLAEYTSPEPFVLPCGKVATWLGRSKMTASHAISWLTDKGLIECVDRSFVFGQGRGKDRARKFRLLA